MKNYCEIIGYKLHDEHTEIKVTMPGNWEKHIKRFTNELRWVSAMHFSSRLVLKV